MQGFFQPDPVVLAFFFIKKFIWLEALAMLALCRVIVANGPARWAAVAAFLLCLAGTATVFAPAAGLNEGLVYVRAARGMALAGGMAVLLAASALMVASGVLPGTRWRWIDLLHGAGLIGLLGLWWWVS